MAQNFEFAEPNVADFAGTTDPVRTTNGPDIPNVLWRRKWIVAFMLVVSGSLGVLYYFQAHPRFESVAQILLIKHDNQLPMVTPEGEKVYEDALSTHIILLGTPPILQRAIEKHNLGKLASLQGEKGPLFEIQENLRPTRAGGRDSPDPNVIDLTFEGSEPEDCPLIINAIVESYQEYLGETFKDNNQETLALITRAKEDLSQQLTKMEEDYQEFRNQAPLFLRGLDGTNTNVYEMRMAEIERERGEVVLAIAQYESRIEAMEGALERGDDRAALNMLIEFTDAMQATVYNERMRYGIEDKLIEAMLSKQVLEGKYGPEHPDVKAATMQLEIMREEMGNDAFDRIFKSEDYLDAYIKSLKYEIKIADQRLAELDGLFKTAETSAKELSRYQLKDETYRNDITRTQDLFDKVVETLGGLTMVQDYGGVDAKLITPPGLGEQIAPDPLKVSLVALVLGLVAGGGLAYAIDAADKRFHTPDEIHHQLGLPIVGHIPVITRSKEKFEDDPLSADLDPILCTYFQPKGRLAEAYRAVRTSLYFNTRGEGHKVIQITSPHPGDGKTTLSANLAVTIADSGKSVLLIEADFRRPRFHKIFGVDDEVGVSSVINGEAEIPDAVRRTGIKNLWTMPCGPKPPNPSELLTSPRFKELVDMLREKYDFVLIDTPPLLAVTDPSAVAPRVDGVLLVISLTKTARDGATRATQMLADLGARVHGVIVNRVEDTNGYYYAGYRYGYGYGGYGGYGYGYGYGDDAYGEGDYYSDEKSNGRRGDKLTKSTK